MENNESPKINLAILKFIGNRVWFDNCGYIWGESDKNGSQMIGEVRGWGAIQHLFKHKDGSIDEASAEAFQDELGAWIADAVDTKLKSQLCQALRDETGESLMDCRKALSAVEWDLTKAKFELKKILKHVIR